MGGPSQVRLQNLTDVHPPWYTQRIENDVNGSALREEGHIFYRHDLGNHPFVAMPTGHLVSRSEFASLRNAHPHHLVHSSLEVTVLIAGEHVHVHHLAALTMRQAQTRVLYLACLFAKNRP